MAKTNMVISGKKLRELRGIRTRSGVTRETGIPYSTLQAYEEGRREPSGSVKERLADYYGVPVESIFLHIDTTDHAKMHEGE